MDLIIFTAGFDVNVNQSYDKTAIGNNLTLKMFKTAHNIRQSVLNKVISRKVEFEEKRPRDNV